MKKKCILVVIVPVVHINNIIMIIIIIIMIMFIIVIMAVNICFIYSGNLEWKRSAFWWWQFLSCTSSSLEVPLQGLRFEKEMGGGVLHLYSCSRYRLQFQLSV